MSDCINGVLQVPSRYWTKPMPMPAPIEQIEPLRKYEEHASYPSLIELPSCGACGKVAARCPCDARHTLPLASEQHPDSLVQSAIRARANDPLLREHCDAVRALLIDLGRGSEASAQIELLSRDALTKLSCDLLDIVPDDHWTSIRLNDAMDRRGL